jgi:hypothetical protein
MSQRVKSGDGLLQRAVKAKIDIKPVVLSINNINTEIDAYAVIGIECAYCRCMFKQNDAVIFFRCRHCFHELCSEQFLHECSNKQRLAHCPQCNAILIGPVIKQTVQFQKQNTSIFLDLFYKLFCCLGAIPWNKPFNRG